MDTKLMLQRDAMDIVAHAKRAIGTGQNFRHEEERNAARSLRCIGQACKHEMNDIFGHVVLAIGNKDFGAEKFVRSIMLPLGSCFERAEVGASLRLRQIHGAGPFARDELCKIDYLQRFARMRLHSLDRGKRQQRAKAERHVRRAPDFNAGGIQERRQSRAAIFGWTGDRVPAARGPGPVSVGEAGRGLDHAPFERRTRLVPGAVQGRKNISGEFSRLLQGRLGKTIVKIGVESVLQSKVQPRLMGHGKKNVGNGSAISHDCLRE